jgi:lysophospholipase L1-like esterase
MATVNGMSAAAIRELVSKSVTGARYNETNHLILTLKDGSEVDAGVAAAAASATWGTLSGKPDWASKRYTALARWYSALANRDYAPAKMVVLGDSISEGSGSSAFGRGWVPQLLNRLRTKFPTSGIGTGGGNGFVATWDNPGYNGAAPSYTYPVTQSGGSFTMTQGFGLKANTLVSTGHQFSYTFTGTSVHVWYILQSTGGSFSVTIDGTVVAASVSTTGTLGKAVWTSAALTAGSHTILVTRLASGGAGTILVTGFRIFNGDEAKGIQMFNGSQSGLTSVQMAATPTAGDKWAPWINTIQPHLVVIELGLNDWSNSLSLANLKTNLKSIATTVRAQTSTDPSIVIYAATQANNGNYASTYTQLHTVWEEVVAEDAKMALFDPAARIPAPHLDNTDGLYYDMLHPSDKGHATIAEYFASFLSPQ